MATHNGAAYLRQQIDSILSQLAEQDELLISDDASTDETLTLVGALTDPRVQFLGSHAYGSPVRNFEFVLQHATGQYVFLADQDDIWEAGKVTTLLPLLREYDLILTDCLLVDATNQLIAPSFFKLRGSRRGFWRNLYQNSYMGCCMAFRAELLPLILPFPARIHMHDWWIGLLAETQSRVYFLDKPLLRYRRHGANASPTGERTHSRWKQLQNRFWMGLSVFRRLLFKNTARHGLRSHSII